MIYSGKAQTELEFGKGDIGFNSGIFNNSNGEVIGMVGFYSQEARQIGDEGDIKIGQECSVDDFPVLMTFTKIESIDVVISALLDAKNQMQVNS